MRNDNLPIHIETKDFLITGESFSLLYDETREMLITHPQPKESDLSAYYESTAYISHTDSKKGLMAFLYQTIKKKSLQKKVRLINKLNGGTGSLLDIGSGTGEFCKAANEAGWKTYGVEPNEKARDFAKKKGVELTDAMDTLRDQQFDVVTLWHVLEHLPNLEKNVSQIRSLVKPGGTLIIAVPNYRSFDASYYKSFWAAFDVPRHLWHFSKVSIPIIFKKDFRLLKVIPMIYDSFYVSLLSEKYKRGSSFSIRAFFIGLWSNIVGWKTKEYSSHIYCFQKSSKSD